MVKIIVLFILTVLGTIGMAWLAYRIRGYWAVGGEWLDWAAFGIYALVKIGKKQDKMMCAKE